MPIRPPIPASAEGKHIIGKLGILNLDARDTLYYADTVLDWTDPACGSMTAPKNCAKGAERNKPTSALGSPDSKFYSLGLGGTLTLGFGGNVFQTADVSVFEITFGTGAATGHREAAEVWAINSSTGASWNLGVLKNTDGGNTVRGSAGAFDQIRLVDVTKSAFASTSSLDGFDVDSVAIAPVPLPAAGAMLLAGLGGFAALRRRKSVA